MVATETITINVPVGMSRYLVAADPESELRRNALLLYPYIYNQTIYFALRFIPSFIAIYFGAQYIGDFMEMLPQFVSNGMNALGGILPAVGIAALLTTTIHNKFFIIFFLVGFTLVVFMNINIIGLTFIAAGIAYLYYIGSDKGTTYTNNTLTVEEEEVL